MYIFWLIIASLHWSAIIYKVKPIPVILRASSGNIYFKSPIKVLFRSVVVVYKRLLVEGYIRIEN